MSGLGTRGSGFGLRDSGFARLRSRAINASYGEATQQPLRDKAGDSELGQVASGFSRKETQESGLARTP